MAIEGIEVRYDPDRDDGHDIVLDVTSDRVDFAGFVFTQEEAVDLAEQLYAAVQKAGVARAFGVGR